MVPVELIVLPPLACAIWLLVSAKGDIGDRPVRERAGMVLGGAALLGPVALWALGLFWWLVLLAGATLAVTASASARRADRPPARSRDDRTPALPSA